MPSAKNVSSALALPRKQRAALAHELIVGLDPGADRGAAEAWRAEIERRAREVEEGTARLEEWATVRRRLKQRWKR